MPPGHVIKYSYLLDKVFKWIGVLCNMCFMGRKGVVPPTGCKPGGLTAIQSGVRFDSDFSPPKNTHRLADKLNHYSESKGDRRLLNAGLLYFIYVKRI